MPFWAVPEPHLGRKQRTHTLLFCLFFTLRGTAKSFVSPTSRKAARKLLCFPLLTQKQGGGGYPKEVREVKEAREVNEVTEAKEVDYNRAFLRPAFTTTLIDIESGSRQFYLHVIGRSQERPASEGERASQTSTLNRFSPLTPIIPVHPRGSPVSPIIPVHTQKQGGGGGMLTSPLSAIVGAPDISVPVRDTNVACATVAIVGVGL